MWYVVDGMDGSGKSTAADIIAGDLESKGRKVLVMTHPNRSTRVGRMELALLRKEGKAAMVLSILFYILDVLRSIRVMRRTRGEYDDVVFVRYIMAVAYLPDGLCGKAYDAISRMLPMPDTAVLVDVDPERAMERIGSRGESLEVYETAERLGRIRARMLSLSDGWIVLDNNGDAASLESQILDRVLRYRSRHPPPALSFHPSLYNFIHQ